MALAFLVKDISPLAQECTGGKSLPFRVSGAHSAVSGQLGVTYLLTSLTGSCLRAEHKRS